MLLRWLFLFWMNRNLCDFIHWLPLLLYFCCFLIHPDSCVPTYVNTFWHRFWWVGKKSKICVFSSSCFCLLLLFIPPVPNAASHTLHLNLHLSLHDLSQPPRGNLNSSSCILPLTFAFLPSVSVLWWGAGWPWIPLLLWGNNRHCLLLRNPLSPTWGPQPTGKEGARVKENTSRVCGREGEWEGERGI